MLYLYRRRNSVDAATFCAFVIALMPWLQDQEGESACQVQYSSTVAKFQRRKGKIATQG